MDIKGIIYDFDGVICDSVDVKTEAFSTLYEPYGKDIQDYVVQYHLQHGGISRFEKIRYYHQHLLGIELKPEEVTALADRFADMVKTKVINSSYIPGAYEFLKENSAYFNQFICTGTPETEILEIVKVRGIMSFFDEIYGAPKKKTQIIKDILALTQLEPSQMLYFGDALTDYYAAMEFNMPFIGIMNSATTFPKGVTTISYFKPTLLQEINI